MSPAIGLRRGGDFVWPRVLALALSLAVVAAVGVVAATSSAAFNPYNPGWDGATALEDRIDAESDVEGELVRDPARYGAVANESTADETVAFVVAPEEPYTDEEAARIRAFVENGGTLVVLENFGEGGNELLADVGAEARMDGRLLRDEHRNDRGPAMPVATAAENHTLTDGVDRLTLNYATAVDPGTGNATVLATTSDVSYLTAADGRLDGADELGPHPVATVEDVGRGRVVAVGDPSLVINAMLDRPDNDRFVRNLYAGEERVMLDVSRSTDVPPLAAAVLTVRADPLSQLSIGVAGIAAIATLSGLRLRSLGPRLRRALSDSRVRDAAPDRRSAEPVLSDAERAALLRQRRPEWDDDRIRRVITDDTRNWADAMETTAGTERTATTDDRDSDTVTDR